MYSLSSATVLVIYTVLVKSLLIDIIYKGVPVGDMSARALAAE